MLTRKEFLHTLAGATAALPTLASAGGSPVSPAPAAAPAAATIGLGASIYSFQDELVLHRMTIQDCIRAVSEMGADGIELLGEQGIPDFPNVPDTFVRDWFGWMSKYGTKPVAYDCMYDQNLYQGRLLSDPESVDIVVRDLKIAQKLGFKLVRAQRTIPPSVLEKTVPHAEQLNMILAIEVHPPLDLKTSAMDPFLEILQKTKTKHFGFVLDFGIFVQRPPRVARDWSLRHGATPSLVDYVDQAYQNRQDRSATLAEVKKMGGNDADQHWVALAYNYGNNDPEQVRSFSEYIFHCHGKFYEMTDDLREYSIAYDKVVPALRAMGYHGYICSEYEGQRHIDDAFEVDSVEQVRRQQAMLRRILGDATGSA